MTRTYWIAGGAASFGLLAGLTLYSQFGAPAAAVSAPAGTEFLIRLGVGDKAVTVWNGQISVTGGKVSAIEGWRFGGKDSTDGVSSWKASTRADAGKAGTINENGVLVTAETAGPSASFAVTTQQGNFSFASGDMVYGASTKFLNGKVLVDRVPAATQLTSSTEEQDFPAIAQSGDDVYVSYVEFTHSDRSLESFAQLKTEPTSFDYLARAAGGDQVFLLHYSKSKRVWESPVSVSAGKLDVMRTAVAVDGQKRVWVFWSANIGGNPDIYAKYRENGVWSDRMRLSNDDGPDLNPVAATDSNGRVWVAWQGYRNGNLEILARAQNGVDFLAEDLVSFSPQSDWDPGIAASSDGEVAISWDTYDKGDYDVYLRRLRIGNQGNVRMDDPVPVAASPTFEARSSIVYDNANRIWVAYEASDTKWGKDFGAYETTGIALYQGHTIKLKCFDGAKAYTTTTDLASVLPAPKVIGKQPDPAIAENRKPNSGAAAPSGPKNSIPRLAADPDGKLYLGFRISSGARAGIGTVWSERLVYFDGSKWSQPVMVAHTDNMLDNRPALAALGGGELLMVSACDHRQSPVVIPKGGPGGVNSDLYAADLTVDRTVQPLKLTAAAAETVPAVSAETKAERDQIALMRGAVASLARQNYQVMRGEFHRHTEISADGGSDGLLADAYRYLIDTAGMDWAGCCDHDNGGGIEYNWWLIQKMTDAYRMDGHYIPMFAYERSVTYPEGHRNVVFPVRGIRPLPRLPKMADGSAPSPAPDTQMLYHYLKHFGGITASHTSGTDMGTDWRDNDPILEPVVEIYQGDRQNYEMPGAPRTNSAGDSIGGWRPPGFVSLALQKGYKLGFQASSDHISTHISYCNVWVKSPTRDGILEGLSARRVYGATDNILADVRCGEHFMGEEFSVSDTPVISVKLQGTALFSKVSIIKDGSYAYAANPNSQNVVFTWQDTTAVKGRTSYYYVRGEQADGELVWASPMWITVQ